MNPIPLFLNTGAPRGATHAFEVSHLDLTEAAVDTPQGVNLITLGDGFLFEVVNSQVIVPFEDSSDGDFDSTTVQVGIAGSLNSQLAAQEVNANGTVVQAKAGTGTVLAPTVATAVVATFTGLPDTKALASLDKGLIRIYAKITDNRA